MAERWWSSSATIVERSRARERMPTIKHSPNPSQHRISTISVATTTLPVARGLKNDPMCTVRPSAMSSIAGKYADCITPRATAIAIHPRTVAMPPGDVTYEEKRAAKSSNSPGERLVASSEATASKMNRLMMPRPIRTMTYTNVEAVAAPALLVNLFQSDETAPPTLYGCG